MIKIIRTSTISMSLYILLKGQLKFLANYFNVIAMSSDNTYLEKVSARENVKAVEIDMERGISPLKDLISLVRLYFQFKKEKPVVVHSITPKAGLLSMLAAKFAGVPIRIHTFTGLVFPSKTGALQKLLIVMDQLLCWAATDIYPEGNGVKNDLIDYGITSKPLKVLANGNVNGIDIEFFNAKEVSEREKNELRLKLNIENDDFIFVFVGRLVGDKGINELINAYKVFSKDPSRFQQKTKLLLVGPFEEDLDPLLQEVLQEINENEHIIKVGFQKDVRPYLAISDALVFPSYREGFPNVVLQAGAMDLPSIVSDINGCNEIIKQDENGIIIPAKNTDAIVAGMLQIINDREYYQKLKNNSRKLIVERYEQSVVWNALLEEYKLLLEQRGYAV